MKAIALACMFLIGMIGFTGFGNTTTDPAKNSETVYAIDGVTASVEMPASIVEAKTETFNVAALATIVSFTTNKVIMPMSPCKMNIIPIYDSGGGMIHFKDRKPNDLPREKEVYRSPRDGINYGLGHVV